MWVCVIIYCKRILILYKLIVKEIINYWVFLRYRCFYWSIIGAVLVENLSVFSHIFFHLYFSIFYFVPLSRHVIRISFFSSYFFFFLNIFFFFYTFFFSILSYWFGSIQRRFYDDHSKCKTCGCLPVTKYKSPLCIPCFYHFKIRIITRIITYSTLLISHAWQASKKSLTACTWRKFIFLFKIYKFNRKVRVSRIDQVANKLNLRDRHKNIFRTKISQNKRAWEHKWPVCFYSWNNSVDASLMWQ